MTRDELIQKCRAAIRVGGRYGSADPEALADLLAPLYQGGNSPFPPGAFSPEAIKANPSLGEASLIAISREQTIGERMASEVVGHTADGVTIELRLPPGQRDSAEKWAIHTTDGRGERTATEFKFGLAALIDKAIGADRPPDRMAAYDTVHAAAGNRGVIVLLDGVDVTLHCVAYDCSAGTVELCCASLSDWLPLVPWLAAVAVTSQIIRRTRSADSIVEQCVYCVPGKVDVRWA